MVKSFECVLVVTVSIVGCMLFISYKLGLCYFFHIIRSAA